jgi:hypothetical protein
VIVGDPLTYLLPNVTDPEDDSFRTSVDLGSAGIFAYYNISS